MTVADVVKNLPVPPARRGRGCTAHSERIVALGIGQRVRFLKLKRPTVRSLAHYWSKRLGRMYVTRTNGTAIDVWRVA